MNLPFSMPEEYLQGLFKVGQNWTPSLPGRFATGFAGATKDPGLMQLQFDHLQQHGALWSRALSGSSKDEPRVATERGDRRFHAPEWRDDPLCSLLERSYLLNARFISPLVEAAEIGGPEKHKSRFFANQLVDAMSPGNFAATNSEVLELAMETHGESLRTGFSNSMGDLRKEGLTITDEKAFEVERNVAVSEGAVSAAR